MDIKPLDAQSLAQRDAYMKAGRIDAPMLFLWQDRSSEQIRYLSELLTGISLFLQS